MAGGPGFEPELPGPEPGVLPLNYPPNVEINGIPLHQSLVHIRIFDICASNKL